MFACCFCAAALLGTADPAPARPNIVFVMVDDLRWDELSCMGHPVVHTPHIDRIAREGVRFRNAFATSPLCSPSRACFLTGQYAHHHGIVDNTDRSAQSHRLPTFPRVLAGAGYEAAYVGKWHMGNDDTPRPGFSYWACLKGQGTSFDPVLNVNGKRREFTGHTTDVINSLAEKFVRGAHEKPFCLYVAHKALHPELTQRDDGSITDPSAARFLPAKRHEQLYANQPVPRRLNALDDLQGKPALTRPIEGLPPLSRETGTSDETVRDRWRMLAAVDEGVGQLFQALEAGEQLENTVMIFTSDHGYWYGEHGLSVERRLAYEEGTRIPLLVRYPPRIRPGLLIDELCLSLDIAPTLFELAAAAPEHQLDGRSLLPLFDETAKSWRDRFVIEYYTDTVFPRVLNMGYKALRTERFKYIHYTTLDGMDELYDLLHDPYEMHNLIADPASQDVLRRLQSDLNNRGLDANRRELPTHR